jgi:carbon storage regulator CsrA
MLVLSRKTQESVVIGGADGFHRLLKVKVLEIRGTQVKLGFDVDPDVPVHRSEVWERVRAGLRLDCLIEDSHTSGIE